MLTRVSDDRATIARLYRRAGFGLTPAELDEAVARGVAAEIDRLTDPDAAGLPEAPNPWADADLSWARRKVRSQGLILVDGWLTRMITTPRPLVERMAWFWHGHFVSSMQKVVSASAMATQVELFQRLGMGGFADLVRAVSVDPAMLIYLDGDDSTGTEPNENYGRELLELFTLGRGAYTEADVQAGARALTGWKLTDRHDPPPAKLRGQASRRHAPDLPGRRGRPRPRFGGGRHHRITGVRAVRRRGGGA